MDRIVTSHHTPRLKAKPKAKAKEKPVLTSRIIRFAPHGSRPDLPEPTSDDRVWDELMRRVREDPA